jgi:phosphoribosylaminoimidazolecarboxamide formyltransferase / IMP cyclohydrolase
LNRAVTVELGEALASQFVEVLFAPGYDEQAMEALSAKASVRILNDTERRGDGGAERDYKRVLGGLLVQERDSELPDRSQMDVVCGEVSHEQWLDLLFAWRVVRHVTSNAIVLARRGQTIGIGAGQMSRVDAVRIALVKARELGHELDGAVLASDAFFPFADGPQLALDAGVDALIQPGGSKRDDEVIEAVSAAGAAMVFTHRRHFRH